MLLGLAGVCSVAMLTGCAGGSATEARVDEQRDLLRTPLMENAQATYTAETFFPKQGTPVPTPEAIPFLGALVITTAVGPGNVPQGQFASVPSDAGTVYAGAQIGNGTAGQHVVGIWTDAWGKEVGRAGLELASSADLTWVAFPLRLDGQLPPGDYGVFIDVDKRRIGSLAFTVTAPGTGAQQLPDLPQNPQAPPPTPTPAPNQGNQQGGQSQGQNQGQGTGSTQDQSQGPSGGDQGQWQGSDQSQGQGAGGQGQWQGGDQGQNQGGDQGQGGGQGPWQNGNWPGQPPPGQGQQPNQ